MHGLTMTVILAAALLPMMGRAGLAEGKARRMLPGDYTGGRVVILSASGKVVWSIEENELPGIPLRFIAGVHRLPNGNAIVCNWLGHGYIGDGTHLFEVTRDKKALWTNADHAAFKTISTVQALDVNAPPVRQDRIARALRGPGSALRPRPPRCLQPVHACPGGNLLGQLHHARVMGEEERLHVAGHVGEYPEGRSGSIVSPLPSRSSAPPRRSVS